MNLFTVFTLVSMNFYVQFGNTYQLDFIVQFLKYNISEMEIKESNKELISKFNFIEGNYISETSHSKLRNILITFQTSGTMLGYLIAYIIGTIFEDWRDSALALVAVPLMGSLTMVIFPETPFWLASVGRLQDSR